MSAPCLPSIGEPCGNCHRCESLHICGRDYDPGCDGCTVVAGDSGGEF